jgi:hypothetical protein
MQIMSFRVTPVARVLAINYAVLGLTYLSTLLLTGAKGMIPPLGIVAPLVFNLNLHLALPTHFLNGVLSAVAAALCYTVTGWLTGAAAVLAFNFAAQQLGGIEASVVVKASRPAGGSMHLPS